MSGRHHYLLSSLPHLGEPGSRPPLSSGELLERVVESDGPRELVQVILLADDLLQREAALAGELDAEHAAPAVLTPAQARGEEPLPAGLAPEAPEAPRAVEADVTWVAYFRQAATTAERRQSAFLASWVAYEVALRNALAAARAKALGLEAQDYLVAPELAADEDEGAATVAEWAGASDPLAGLRVLDRSRWRWLTEHEGWFSFADDEVAAYAARLALLHRWHRLTDRRAESRQAQAVGG